MVDEEKIEVNTGDVPLLLFFYSSPNKKPLTNKTNRY